MLNKVYIWLKGLEQKWFLALLIPVVLAVTFLILRQGFLSGGDVFYPYSPTNYLKNLFPSWGNFYNLGSVNYFFSDTYLYLIWSGLYKLSSHPRIVQFIWFSLLSYQIVVFMTLLFNKYSEIFQLRKNNWITLLAILVYLLNPVYLLLYSQSTFLIAYAFIPFLVYSIFKIFYDQNLRYIIIFPLLSILFYYLGDNPPLLAASFMIPISIILVLFAMNRNKVRFLSRLCLTSVIYLLTNAFWIIPLLSLSNKGSSGADSSTGALSITSHNSSLANLFKFTGNWVSGSTAFGSQLSLISKFYSGTTYTVIAFFLLACLVIGLVYLLIRGSKRLKLTVTIGLLLIMISIFLSAGSHAPTGGIFTLLYDKVPFMWLFREPWTKFMPGYVFIITSLLFIISSFSTRHLKKIVIGAQIIFISFSIFVLFSNTVVPGERGYLPGFNIHIPGYFKEYVNESCSSDDRTLDGETLLMPKNPFYQIHLFWPFDGYYGYDPLLTNGCRPVIGQTPLGGYVQQSDTDQVIKMFYDNYSKSNFDLLKYASLFNAKYILVRNDLDWTAFGGVDANEKESPQNIHKIITRPGISLEKSYGKIESGLLDNDQYFVDLRKAHPLLEQSSGMDLFRIDDQYLNSILYTPNRLIKSDNSLSQLPDMVSAPSFDIGDAVVFNSQNSDVDLDDYEAEKKPKITFDKSGHTRYRVSVKGAESKFPLIFNQSYDQYWKLSPQSESHLSWSGKLKQIFSPTEVADSKHFKANGFANGWIVDSDKICKENNTCNRAEDGSYNLELSINFSQQNKYDWSFSLSVLTLLASITYLITKRARKVV